MFYLKAPAGFLPHLSPPFFSFLFPFPPLYLLKVGAFQFFSVQLRDFLLSKTKEKDLSIFLHLLFSLSPFFLPSRCLRIPHSNGFIPFKISRQIHNVLGQSPSPFFPPFLLLSPSQYFHDKSDVEGDFKGRSYVDAPGTVSLPFPPLFFFLFFFPFLLKVIGALMEARKIK